MNSPYQLSNSLIQMEWLPLLNLRPQQLSIHNHTLFNILRSQTVMVQNLLENWSILLTELRNKNRLQSNESDNNQYSDQVLSSKVQQEDRQKDPNVLKNSAQTSDRQAFIQLLTKSRSNKTKIQIVSSSFKQKSLSLEKTDDEYQNSKNVESKKGCQTKNIIKNYGKSILSFIRKNKILTKKVLEEFEIDQEQFYDELQNFKNKVNSITDLKLFWTRKGNRFDKIFRILSNIYLKKHSLKHTFCSRVRNHAIHIKYRKRLLQILQQPDEFNSIKYI